MAYSTVAVQQMNLAHYYPPIFWNTANLIVDSAGIDEEEMFSDDLYTEDASTKEEEENDEDGDVLDGVLDKPKKKVKVVDYGKISSAIGKMRESGIAISLPDINKSDFTFTPDVENDTIIFGLKGIGKINTDLAKEIIRQRPYSSFVDFTKKVKIYKLPTINLIKAGAFDKLEARPREEIMNDYLVSIADQKSRLTMANVPMLIKYGVFPEQFDFERRMYNFNKYLKKNKKGDYYLVDEKAIEFYLAHFSADELVSEKGKNMVLQKTWDKWYAAKVDRLKVHLKGNTELLDALNRQLFRETFEKYALGNISTWEMDSVGFYYHQHEMANVNRKKYDIRNFSEEPEVPTIERIIRFKTGAKVPLYELWRIAGTVIDKDKMRNTVTLLTTDGVVTVKIYRPQFSKYDRQIFEKKADGTKRVVEKSWFTRGNMIMFTGMRRENSFFPKVYKSSEYRYPVQLVKEIKENGDLVFQTMRSDD